MSFGLSSLLQPHTAFVPLDIGSEGESPASSNAAAIAAVLLPPAPISATVLTYNSSNSIARVLAALQWCDEVIVLDTGSSDETGAIASSFKNVSVHCMSGPFPGFGIAHRRAVALAKNDWILSIDSDEVISPQLVDELRRTTLCSGTVYAFPFHNYFNDRLITSCGWFPDRHERLFDRRRTNFCVSDVHERVETRGLVVETLQHAVMHFSYEGCDDFLRKMRTYSALFANQNVGRKRSSAARAIRHGLWAFVKSYLLQRGVLQGYEGFVISAYKAQATFWKYLALREANRRACG